jgi:hypothetical protein
VIAGLLQDVVNFDCEVRRFLALELDFDFGCVAVKFDLLNIKRHIGKHKVGALAKVGLNRGTDCGL